MKLDRLTLPNAPFLGALNQNTSHVEAARHGCELNLDPKTGLVAIFKGDRVTLVKDWLSVDVSDTQEDADDAAAGGGAGAPPRRGRPPKNTPPVQT